MELHTLSYCIFLSRDGYILRLCVLSTGSTDYVLLRQRARYDGGLHVQPVHTDVLGGEEVRQRLLALKVQEETDLARYGVTDVFGELRQVHLGAGG